MINNPDLIEEIKEQLKNTTREQLDEAMKLTDEEEKGNDERMEVIKINEYVRTKTGFIGKVIGRHGSYGLHYEIDINQEIQDNMMNGIVREDNIIKHSKNIIDLIEEGDYVNGRKIERINDYGEHKRADFNLDFDDCDAVYNEDVKTILTHEQYEINSYRLEG